MSDKSVTKVQAASAPRGRRGQKYLATGIHLSMRLWDRGPAGEPKPPTKRDYETIGYVVSGRAELHLGVHRGDFADALIGYVVSGRAELHLEGQMVHLEPGDCWVVPKGASHSYKILEPFTAVEATSPPAEVHGRDE